MKRRVECVATYASRIFMGNTLENFKLQDGVGGTKTTVKDMLRETDREG